MGANLQPVGNYVADLAETRELRDAMSSLTRDKQWLNEQHLQLCRVPAPTFLEQRRAEWMLAQFRMLDWRASIDRAGNVVAVAAEDGEESRPIIAVTAHLDTVLAPRRDDDVYVDSDGNLRGPGVSDNGAGLAALLALARTIPPIVRNDARRADLALIANVGEEGEGNLAGMRFLCGASPIAQRIAAFVVVDGAATEHITTRALGSRRFDVVFSGSGGHSWNDFGIGNPVHALARAITHFSENRLPPQPRSSFNVGVIEGGASVNSIPSEARAKIDIRSESNDTMDEIVSALEHAVERALEAENQRASTGKLTSKLREIGCRPAASLPENSPLLTFVKGVDAHLGIRSRLECSSTDANVPLSLNRPALSLGAGGQGGGAHTAHEWYNPEGRDLGIKRILLIAALLSRHGLT